MACCFGIKLASSIVEALVIDEAHPDFPLQPDIQHRWSYQKKSVLS